MRRWPALLAAIVLVTGLDVAVVVHRSGGSPRPLTSTQTRHAETTRSATGATTTAVARLLDARAAAVRRRDLTAFTLLLDPTSAAFVSTQRTEFVAMAQLPLTDVSYHADAASAINRVRPVRYGRLPTFAPTVTLSYEIADFDQEPVTSTEVDTFVERDGRWLFASDADFGAPTPEIWRYGPLQVVRGAHSLVVAQPDTVSVARALAAEVDRDIPPVTAVWGDDWSQRAVVIMPATQADLAALVGETADLSQIAAVESAELGRHQPAGARILINPDAYASLSPLGRQVVLTHELTHVASRTATTTASPLWLVEGLADYVGFARTDLATTTIAAELEARLRTGFVPTALPGDAAFGTAAPDLGSQYQEAWLACRLIAARIGAAGLVAFYRDVGATTVDDALRARLHEDTAQFTRDWLTYLHQQLPT